MFGAGVGGGGGRVVVVVVDVVDVVDVDVVDEVDEVVLLDDDVVDSSSGGGGGGGSTSGPPSIGRPIEMINVVGSRRMRMSIGSFAGTITTIVVGLKSDQGLPVYVVGPGLSTGGPSGLPQ